jgi:hypothetical protein
MKIARVAQKLCEKFRKDVARSATKRSNGKSMDSEGFGAK